MEKYTSLEHTIKKVVVEQNYSKKPMEEAVGAIGTDKPHDVPRAFFKSVHVHPRKGEAQIPATGVTRSGRNYEMEKAGVHKEETIDESKAALAQKLFTPRGGAAVPKPSTPPAPKPPGEVVPFPKQTPEPATPPVKPAEPTPVAPPAKPATTPAPETPVAPPAVAPAPSTGKTPSAAPAPDVTPGQGKAPSVTPAPVPSPKQGQTPKPTPVPPFIPGLGGGLSLVDPNKTTEKRIPVTSRFAVPHKRRQAHFEETRYDIKNVSRPEDKREDSTVGRPNDGKSKYTKQAEIIRKVVEEKKIVINKKKEENLGKNPLVDTEPTLKYNPLDQGSKDVR